MRPKHEEAFVDLLLEVIQSSPEIPREAQVRILAEKLQERMGTILATIAGTETENARSYFERKIEELTHPQGGHAQSHLLDLAYAQQRLQA